MVPLKNLVASGPFQPLPVVATESSGLVTKGAKGREWALRGLQTSPGGAEQAAYDDR